jgi:hypothetical protein
VLGRHHWQQRRNGQQSVWLGNVSPKGRSKNDRWVPSSTGGPNATGGRVESVREGPGAGEGATAACIGRLPENFMREFNHRNLTNVQPS